MARELMKTPIMFCTIPSTTPPITQPGRLTKPPMIAAASARITIDAHVGREQQLRRNQNAGDPREHRHR